MTDNLLLLFGQNILDVALLIRLAVMDNVRNSVLVSLS